MDCRVVGVFTPVFDGLCPARTLEQAPCHLIACGLIGEPVPPVITSGGPQKKNS
jgi:hypothetical protein